MSLRSEEIAVEISGPDEDVPGYTHVAPKKTAEVEGNDQQITHIFRAHICSKNMARIQEIQPLIHPLNGSKVPVFMMIGG